MQRSPRVGVLLLQLTLGLCVGVQGQGRHSSSHWQACMHGFANFPKVSPVYVADTINFFFFDCLLICMTSLFYDASN